MSTLFAIPAAASGWCFITVYTKSCPMFYDNCGNYLRYANVQNFYGTKGKIKISTNLSSIVVDSKLVISTARWRLVVACLTKVSVELGNQTWCCSLQKRVRFKLNLPSIKYGDKQIISCLMKMNTCYATNVLVHAANSVQKPFQIWRAPPVHNNSAKCTRFNPECKRVNKMLPQQKCI